MAVWLFFVISIFYTPVHVSSLFDHEIHAVCYAIIIVNVSMNERTLVNLENRLLNFLGKISYGLYVYHMLIIWALSCFLTRYLSAIPGLAFRYIAVYVLVYGLTVFIAYLSYRYFESYFMGWKAKFAKVHSTNEAQADAGDLKNNINTMII